MNDHTLLRLALLVSIVGLAALFIVSQKVSVSEQVISRLDELPEGNEVKVTGVVLRASDHDNVLFLDLAEEKVEKTTVVVFKDRNVSVHEGDVVTVTGSLSDYQGRKEIVGNKLEVK